MARFLLLLLCVLGASLPSTGWAADLYVNNVMGSDLFDGRHPEPLGGLLGPVRTIGRALALAEKYDRVVVANTGVAYRESLSLSGAGHQGSELKPFIVEGNGAVLDGSAGVPPAAWEHYAGDVFRFQPPRMAHQQLFLNDRPAERREFPGEAADPRKLRPLEWALVDGFVYFRVEPGKWIDDYRLSHTLLPTGITLYQVRHVAVLDLVVQGFQLDGVNIHDAMHCTLSGLTCRGNGRSGIAVVGASEAVVEACLVGDNAAAQLLSEGYSTTVVRDSVLLPKTAPPVLRRGGNVIIER